MPNFLNGYRNLIVPRLRILILSVSVNNYEIKVVIEIEHSLQAIDDLMARRWVQSPKVRRNHIEIAIVTRSYPSNV